MKAELRHTVRFVVRTAVFGTVAALGATSGCERGGTDHEALASSGANEKSVLHLGAPAPEARSSAARETSAAGAGSLPDPALSSAGAGGGAGASSSEEDNDGAASGGSTLGGAARSARDAAKGQASGSASPSCVKGWITPARGTALRKAALDMIRANAGERFGVVEMRYFVGPEDAEVLSPQSEIERWYVKAYSLSDPERRQRWLVRRAPVGRGVDAVAPFDSHGYGPRTWKRVDATDENFADPFLRPCNRTKPGTKCMGLPREVLGCLSGT